MSALPRGTERAVPGRLVGGERVVRLRVVEGRVQRLKVTGSRYFSLGRIRAQVPATLAPWGAEVLFRGKTAATLAGRHPHTDTVVIRFPDTNAVNGWYGSSTYQALIPLREAAAEVVLVSFTD